MPTLLPPETGRRLVSALSCALDVLPSVRSNDHEVVSQIARLRDTPESAPTELRQLLMAVHSCPIPDLFAYPYEPPILKPRPIDVSLVLWLLSRSHGEGPERAVDDFARYLQAEALDLTKVLAIDGLSLESAIPLGEYELIPWRDLPQSDTKWRIEAALIYSSCVAPSAAILRPHSIHRTNGEGWDVPTTPPGPTEDAMDILRCVTVVHGEEHACFTNGLNLRSGRLLQCTISVSELTHPLTRRLCL